VQALDLPYFSTAVGVHSTVLLSIITVHVLVDCDSSDYLSKGIRLSQKGQEYTFTVRDLASIKGPAFRVNYDGFVDDVEVRVTTSYILAVIGSTGMLFVPWSVLQQAVQRSLRSLLQYL
jgi:hypothetical protein